MVSLVPAQAVRKLEAISAGLRNSGRHQPTGNDWPGAGLTAEGRECAFGCRLATHDVINRRARGLEDSRAVK